MGNCCDTIDKQLTEFVEFDETTKSTIRGSFNPESLNSTTEKGLTTSIPEELGYNFSRFRNQRNKLNTIIEDRYEDNVSSPIKLKRARYN